MLLIVQLKTRKKSNTGKKENVGILASRSLINNKEVKKKLSFIDIIYNKLKDKMGFAINSSDDNESEIEANLPISNLKPTNITSFTNEETIIHYSQLFSNINIPEVLINDIETKENEMKQKDPLDVENNIQESINKELFQFNNNEEALEFTIPPLVDISSPEKEIPKAPNLIPISALKKKPSLSLLFRNYPDDLNYSDSENKDSSLPKLFLRPGYMNIENETINSDVSTIDSDSFYKIENFLSFSNPTEAENNNTFVSCISLSNFDTTLIVYS